ncbi:hypothetical protein NR224_02405 [Pediococcus ethanolidurans]|nr:hypothetical protein [Pediococcus ethanolidurans]MCV3321071.1 hypothetical protein [Pediococcus ethanolidurans]
MKIVIIFDHPYTANAWKNIPHNRSFLAAILKKSVPISHAVEMMLI